jgi:hypothetical protein
MQTRGGLRIAHKLGWSATDFILLRDGYENEMAASGSSVMLSEEDWMARHQAFERQKMNMTSNIAPFEQGGFDFAYGRKS